MKHLLKISAAALALAAATCSAQVTVTDPWVRGTVAQQTATGAFMQLQSPQDTKLIKAASPVAGVVEVHEMAMDGSIMKMRALPDGLALPAGKAVELKPGGYHVMLMDLKKQALTAGDTVPLTLTFQDKTGKTETVEVKAQVRTMPRPAGAMPMNHQH